MDDLLKRMMTAKEADGLWREGDTIVVAVSGGPDSMALLHLLHRAASFDRLQLIAAHADHGFRGKESEDEAAMVEAYAESLRIPYASAKLDMPTYIEETGLNGQLASRMKRYEFLHQVAQRSGASRIALAHHADDQAETVLMRLLRGAGTSGLAGIPVKRPDKNVELIRPLLRIYKTELVAYAQNCGLPYAIDSSNKKRDYWRNELRLDVLPLLTQHNPQLAASLNRLAEIASAENEWMQEETHRIFELAVSRRPGPAFELGRADLARLPVALQRRLIKLILNYLSMETAGSTPGEGADFEQIERMRSAAAAASPTTWSTDAGAGIRFDREYDRLRWSHRGRGAHPPCPPYEYTLEGTNGTVHIPEGGMTFRLTHDAAAAVERGPYSAAFDADKLACPLIVRNRRPGDRMSVFGLNGTKKVQDMFVDLKIPPSVRDRMPLLVDAEGKLLWIPGARRSDAAPVTPDTTNRLCIQAVPFAMNFE